MDLDYIERAFVEPEQSYFLFGPRGTGKSTMTYRRHPQALVIDLRRAELRYRLSAQPDQLTELVHAQPPGATIIIDEIQKIPELLSLVHRLIEEKRGWKFILTGSSARKLKRQGVDLMGGRALRKNLYPFMACELKEKFDLTDALKFGLLPLRFGQADPFETLQAYLHLYLEEEVKTEGLIRNYEPFTRFLQVMSFSHGALLNVTNIARDCFVQRTTVAHWITILEELLIAFQLSPFTQRAKRAVATHPKFYFFDAGVFQALRPRSLLDTTQEIDGAGMEGLVAQHLAAWKEYTKEKHELSFWRTRAGAEVDFVLLGPLGFWALEVKNSTTIRPNDLRSLRSFCEEYPEATPILIYRGTERLLKHNILCIPCEQFLQEVVPNQPLTR